nr:unnamed protein product [Spirometra erinaceieuropaei]
MEAISIATSVTGSPCFEVLTAYRPPRRDQFADTHHLEQLERFSSRPNIVIMSDFNAPGMNWNTLQASGPKSTFGTVCWTKHEKRASRNMSDDCLLVKLHIPLGDLGNSELLVEDGILYFSAPPYYLRLELPGDVLEAEDHIKLELEKGDLLVTLTKATPGDFFRDLDLLSKFIIKPTKTDQSPLKCGIKMLDTSVEKEPEDHKYEWFNRLEKSEDEESSFIQLVSYSYGFANSKQGLFTSKEELSLPIDLPDPDHCPPSKRRTLQLRSVQDHFSPEHYIADFCEPEAAAAALSEVVPWMCQQKCETDEQTEGAPRPPLTDDHRHRLIVLADHRLPLLPPVTSCQAGELDRTYLYLGLLDLLLAFTHDFCVREGDGNSESAWVIVKLASTLSWLEVFTDLPTLIQTFYARALSFPLVRNWSLCRKVQSCVASLLQSPEVKSWCLYILLEIRHMLVEYPGYYIFIDLFLDDYIVWLQTAASLTVLRDLGEHLAAYKMKKGYVDLPLRELERLSADIIESERLASELGAVTLAP